MAHSASVHSRSISTVVHQLRDCFLVHQPSPTSLIFPRQPLSLPRSFVVCARRKKPRSAITSSRSFSKNSKKKKRTLTPNDDSADDDLEEDDSGNDESEDDDLEEDDSDDDAFEELFQRLEEDLKNDDGTYADDDEITEEDAAKLERELANALGEDDAGYIIADDDEEEEDEDYADEAEDEDDDEDEGPTVLRNWQLRRLAAALKVGRRKVGIKNLAAELCLDRALVLQLLREPPPKLLMMSLTLPNEPAATDLAPAYNLTVLEADHQHNVDEEKSVEPAKSEVEENMPIHLLQQKWYARKRLKKAQVDTLEKVYMRSKRPTDAMINSIVHVTNLPRRKVIKWFEDKRAENGVRSERLSYQNSIR